MEFVISINQKGNRHYMQDYCGADAFTDDIGHAILFDNIDEVRYELHDGEEFWPIVRDDEGDIVGIDTTYQH